MDLLAILAPPAAAATLALGSLRLLVPLLPEPVPSQDDPTPGWSKAPYARLACRRTLALTGAAGFGAGLVCTTQPSTHLPLLLVLAGPTAALVVTDHETTYLPLWLTRFCGALTLLGGAATSLLCDHPTAFGLQLLAGALAAACFFWLVWRAGAGLGFGDVRLAPLLGAGAASAGWPCWWAALLLGTALGAVVGLGTTLWRRQHPHPLGSTFAYGPSLWLGLWLGLLLT